MIPIKFCPSTRSQTYRKIEIESRLKIYDGMKVRSKEVFRIKKRDKNFPRRAEAHLETSYAREIRILLSSYKKGEGFKDFARRKNWNCKKVMLAPRCLWMAIFFFFFLPFTGREAFAKCDYFTRERSTFPPLIFALWTVKGRNAFLERYKRAVRLVRSFIHSFFLRSFRFNALCPMNLFFFLSFFICTPLESWSKGDIFLERLQLTRIGEWKV